METCTKQKVGLHYINNYHFDGNNTDHFSPRLLCQVTDKQDSYICIINTGIDYLSSVRFTPYGYVLVTVGATKAVVLEQI